MFFVYILFSVSKNKHYTGQTNNLEDRIKRHNAGSELATKYGKPWQLIRSFEFTSRSEAMALESKIKKRGASRFIEDLKNSEKV